MNDDRDRSYLTIQFFFAFRCQDSLCADQVMSFIIVELWLIGKPRLFCVKCYYEYIQMARKYLYVLHPDSVMLLRSERLKMISSSIQQHANLRRQNVTQRMMPSCDNSRILLFEDETTS